MGSLLYGCDISDDELRLLARIHRNVGRKAKQLIREAWETGNYDSRIVVETNDDSMLQRLRNRCGPTWLSKISLSAIASSVESEAENLDGLDVSELHVICQDDNRNPLIRDYAACKARAIECRLAGRVADALKWEQSAEYSYKRLPPHLKW